MQENKPWDKRTALKDYLLQPHVQKEGLGAIVEDRVDWERLANVFELLKEIVPAIELFAVIEAQILRDAELLMKNIDNHLNWLRYEAHQLKTTGTFQSELTQRLNILEDIKKTHRVKLRIYDSIRSTYPDLVISLRKISTETEMIAA